MSILLLFRKTIWIKSLWTKPWKKVVINKEDRLHKCQWNVKFACPFSPQKSWPGHFIIPVHHRSRTSCWCITMGTECLCYGCSTRHPWILLWRPRYWYMLSYFNILHWIWKAFLFLSIFTVTQKLSTTCLMQRIISYTMNQLLSHLHSGKINVFSSPWTTKPNKTIVLSRFWNCF